MPDYHVYLQTNALVHDTTRQVFVPMMDGQPITAATPEHAIERAAAHSQRDGTYIAEPIGRHTRRSRTVHFERRPVISPAPDGTDELTEAPTSPTEPIEPEPIEPASPDEAVETAPTEPTTEPAVEPTTPLTDPVVAPAANPPLA